MTRLARARAALIVAVGVALLISAPAFAHAFINRTDPVDGAVLAEAPRQIRLWFSEEIAVNLSKFALNDNTGSSLPLGSVRADASDPALIIIDLPDLKPNAYRVTWDVLSTDDLHLRSGSIVFGVQTAADGAAVAQASTAPQPLEVLIRWIDFVALATLIGALAIALLVAAPGDTEPALIVSTERRLLKLALAATVLALMTSLGGVLIQALTLSSGSARLSVVDAAVQLLTQTSYGSRWLMREGWSITLLFLIVWQRRQPTVSRLALSATLPLLFALAVLQAMNGHAASFNDTSNARIAAAALHLLGAGVWVGGLIALATAIVPLLRRGSVESALARSILRRFGLVAAASLGLLLVTGLYNSGQQVASVDALLFTFYGQSLLLKIVLILCVGAIGLINSSLLHPDVANIIRRLLHRPLGGTLAPGRHLWRTITIEAISASVILLFAALLGSSQPARGPEFDPPSESAIVKTASANVADLSVTFSIKPNRPGQNFISVGAFDTRRPAPAPIRRVTVHFMPPDGAPDGAGEFVRDADLIGNGKYQIAGDAINLAGNWRITVAVQRPGLADVVWTLPWTVASPTEANRRPVQVSNQPLAPWFNLAAVLSALMVLGTAIGLWWRYRPPSTSGSPAPLAPREARK